MIIAELFAVFVGVACCVLLFLGWRDKRRHSLEQLRREREQRERTPGTYEYEGLKRRRQRAP